MMKTPRPYLAFVLTSVAIAGFLPLAGPASGEEHGLSAFRRMLHKRSADLTTQTGETLEALGLKTADVVPVLADVLTRPRVRIKVRRAAVTVALHLAEAGEGEPLVPILTRAIHDEDPLVVSDALRALRNVGPPAVSAVPEMIGIMRDTPSWQTLQAIQSIGAGAVPYLVEGLKSDALVVRTTCAQALTDLGAEQQIRGPLTDPFDDPRGELQALADQSPLFVARVEKLLGPPTGLEDLEVVFEALATPYRLERDHPDFELFRTRLEASLGDGRKVLFAHESGRLTRVLRGSRPDWLQLDASPRYGCLLVTDDPALQETDCTLVSASMLGMSVTNYLNGFSFLPVSFLTPLLKGELFFWSSRERQVLNAGLVENLTDRPAPSILPARLAHPSLEEALAQALTVPDLSPKATLRLNDALRIVRDELKTYGGSADP